MRALGPFTFALFLGVSGLAFSSGACSGAVSTLPSSEGDGPSPGEAHAIDAAIPDDSALPSLGDASITQPSPAAVDAGSASLGFDAAAPVAEAAAPVADGAAPPPGPMEAGPSSGGEAGGPPGTMQVVEMTFYGWDDNTPPGNGIAYPKSAGNPTIHGAAGGTGSYGDPITFATDKSELPPGTRVYAPAIEKYLVMEDDCPACDTQWSGSKAWHVNVWMNSDGMEQAKSLAACEAQWMQAATTIEVDPPAGRKVTANPLFVPATDTCRTTP